MEDQTLYTLISKHLSGETSVEEDDLLWEWIDKNPAHLKMFQQLVETYTGKSQWTKNLLEEEKNLPNLESREKKIWTKSLWRVAAAVVFGTSIGIYLYQSALNESTEIKTLAG